MPGIALRIAASMTVAPFSTSIVRDSPLWSTKVILAMFARNGKTKEGPGSPITGRSDQRYRDAGPRSGHAGPVEAASGRLEHCLDRRPCLRHRMIELEQDLRWVVPSPDRAFQRRCALGDAERANGACRT